MNTIGKQLKALRKSQKKTQQAVADKVGITRATLSNYEIDRRTPDLKTLRRLAECYGVGLDYFGIATADEVLELLARAKEVFESDQISKERKNELFDAIMRLKLNIK
jgi:transcriptional regulator with XRE-family HTH domain